MGATASIPINKPPESITNSNEKSITIRKPKNYFQRSSIVRKPILITLEDVLDSKDARERLIIAINMNPPGVLYRWSKILDYININIEPTKNNLDPLRISITMDVLKQCYQHLYNEINSINSLEFSNMRTLIPKMYDSHNINKIIKISQNERFLRDLSDECYCYGELNHEIYSTIYIKFIKTYGDRNKGIFYDLGCGIGTNVYASAFIGNFTKCIGIECIDSLLERGEKRMIRWNKSIKGLSPHYKSIEIHWEFENLFNDLFWLDGTFYLLHWTAFSNQQKQKLSDIMNDCSVGTIVITLTTPLLNSSYEILIKDKCETSWGISEFYIHEKISNNNTIS